MEVKWEDRFSTGSHIIDNQHKRLIQNINNLSKAIDQGRPGLEVRKVLEYLEGYTVSHFKKEEEFMLKYNYPEYTFHKKEHAKSLKIIKELKTIFRRTHTQ